MICNDCEFLGNNGVCGYCKFTYECFDGEEDLLDDKRLPNCPFRKDFNEWAGIVIEQQSTIQSLKEENEVLLENLFERQEDFRKSEKEYHERIMNYQKEIKWLENIIYNLKNEINNLKNQRDFL